MPEPIATPRPTRRVVTGPRTRRRGAASEPAGRLTVPQAVCANALVRRPGRAEKAGERRSPTLQYEREGAHPSRPQVRFQPVAYRGVPGSETPGPRDHQGAQEGGTERVRSTPPGPSKYRGKWRSVPKRKGQRFRPARGSRCRGLGDTIRCGHPRRRSAGPCCSNRGAKPPRRGAPSHSAATYRDMSGTAVADRTGPHGHSVQKAQRPGTSDKGSS